MINNRKLKKAQKKILDAQLIIAKIQYQSYDSEIEYLNELVCDYCDLVSKIQDKL